MIRQLFARMRPERPADAFRSGFNVHEQRSGVRIENPRRVQVIHEDDECPTARPDISLGLMKDFSADGCKLLVPGGVAADTLWVRVVGRDPREEFIECRVMWRGDAPSQAMQPCGVQFQRVMSREEFEETLASRTHAISA